MRSFNKIFGIGLPSAGPTELASALAALGVQTVQWPRNMLDIAQATASVDITVACRFRELDQLFPGSLFVYTERSLAKWLDAIVTRYRALGETLHLPEGERVFALEADVRVFGTTHPLQCDLATAYARHDAAIRRYFDGRADRLLTIDVDRDDWEDALVTFLDMSG